MTSPNWTCPPNYLILGVPERFEQPKGPRSPDGLGITLISGEDNMRELQAAIKAGGEIRIETQTDTSDANKVRVGQVLQVPPYLDKTMVLCAGGPKGFRTLADVTHDVEVGDTVHLDPSCLIDENEILPGVYRVPYSAVICVVGRTCDPWAGEIPYCQPVGGYVLLERVWADDVTDETDAEGGLVKCRKQNGLVVETAVPPLANEGVVAFVGTPLRGTLPEIQPGQRVVVKPGLALVERIAGVEYLCVRQDYVLAVRQEHTEFDINAMSGSATAYVTEYFASGADPANAAVRVQTLLPLEHIAYNA